ncbi:hypothetical protein EPA93_41300 [Ktedonosporobacter rubrisoli]|uniref:Uncharacterized protein n=1 Tax=Ktedonosporobacter rubrisoli TaxID=2509675 RepID=A0A4P6K1T8_KTERU|nr:hypothetical protein [Ktedonosporobacter rubrisoli]QBD82074.1 hypothetical protein EPA93_41300 [Ktedonosporobacter rubrisoli]
MPAILANVHVHSWLGVWVLLILWVVLFKCAHLLVMLVRHGPMIGWAIGPLGITIMFLHEPSMLYIWLNVFCPALVSGVVLYVGLFTSISPIMLPEHPFVQIIIVSSGVLLTSLGDFVNALRDLRHPLWGEARILRSIQFLRASYAKIHFTPFGHSYLSDHFGANPTDLLQAL